MKKYQEELEEIEIDIPRFIKVRPSEITLEMCGWKAPCSRCIKQDHCYGDDCNIYREWRLKVYRKDKK